MIPEAVTDVTSVTTLKTASFDNGFGHYSYQSVKPELFFGYRPVELPTGAAAGTPRQTWMISDAEKALLDLLYLYPFYDSEAELEQLRLDEDYMTSELDLARLQEFQRRIGCAALDARVRKLLKIYGL